MSIENAARFADALIRERVRDGGRVMAPGNREWEVVDRRRAEGIPVDPATSAFLGL